MKNMSASTNTAVEIPHNDNTTVGTWQTTPSPAKVETFPDLMLPDDFYVQDYRKNPKGNSNVDKKVKRVGWSKQFFEK